MGNVGSSVLEPYRDLNALTSAADCDHPLKKKKTDTDAFCHPESCTPSSNLKTVSKEPATTTWKEESHLVWGRLIWSVSKGSSTTTG